MRIAIIEAGEPPAPLVPAFGTYGTMIRDFLPAGHAIAFFRAFDGALPAPGEHDAAVISGSACGVYDGHPWIADLERFAREAAALRRKLVGICFGHQLLAQAFGGRVTKAPAGWGVGLQRYDIVDRVPWMDGPEPILEDHVDVAASHQDQVVALPPGARVLARSAFTPHALLGYADHPTISCQFHPEFTPAFARALLEARRSPAIGDGQREAAIRSYDAPNSNARVAGWVARFLAD